MRFKVHVLILSIKERMAKKNNAHFEGSGALRNRLAYLLVVCVHIHFFGPELALVAYFLALVVEMVLYDFLEAGRRLSNHLKHAPFDGGLTYIGIVFDGGCGAGRRASRPFVARLVKVGL